MKKNIHSKITLVFFLCLTLHLATNAQIHQYFIINGKVISDSEWTDKGKIQIIKNDQLVVSTQIPEYGRFRLELDYNADYKLIFSQKGCLSKTVKVNTEIPEEVVTQKTNLSHFLMEVRLSKDMEESYLVPENQCQQIKYSPELNNFGPAPTGSGQEFVENEKIIQNQAFQTQESKSKM